MTDKVSDVEQTVFDISTDFSHVFKLKKEKKKKVLSRHGAGYGPQWSTTRLAVKHIGWDLSDLVSSGLVLYLNVACLNSGGPFYRSVIVTGYPFQHVFTSDCMIIAGIVKVWWW